MTRVPLGPAVGAVAALIRTRTELVDTDDGRIRTTQPCLLAMLTTYLIHASSGGRGGGHSAGSVPIDTAAWDLLVEIRYDTHAWAQHLGIDPKPYANDEASRSGKPATPAIGRLLRAVAAQAESTGHQPVADAITRCARRWTSRIEQMLAGEPDQRGIRGARCPECLATTIQEQREDPDSRRRDDGLGTFHTAAVVLIAGRELDEEATLCCLACGWHSPLGAAAEVIAMTRRGVLVDEDQGEAA